MQAIQVPKGASCTNKNGRSSSQSFLQHVHRNPIREWRLHAFSSNCPSCYKAVQMTAAIPSSTEIKFCQEIVSWNTKRETQIRKIMYIAEYSGE